MVLYRFLRGKGDPGRVVVTPKVAADPACSSAESRAGGLEDRAPGPLLPSPLLPLLLLASLHSSDTACTEDLAGSWCPQASPGKQGSVVPRQSCQGVGSLQPRPLAHRAKPLGLTGQGEPTGLLPSARASLLAPQPFQPPHQPSAPLPCALGFTCPFPTLTAQQGSTPLILALSDM